MPTTVVLRLVEDADLEHFFEHGRDPEAVYMAAFTRKDPSNHETFAAHWAKIRADPEIVMRTIVVEGQVAGSILCYPNEGKREVTYWLGREFWGRGIATKALSAFITQPSLFPLYARVAKDNHGSIRVLEKCGFITIGEDRGFANARGIEIDELVMRYGTQ